MRIRYLLIGAVVVLAVAAGGGGYWWWQARQRAIEPPPSQFQPTPVLAFAARGSIRITEADGRSMPIDNPWFVTMTQDSGVDFLHNSGTTPEKPFPAANGSGGGALDFDLDGRYDLYFATGTPFPLDPKQTRHINRLYRNFGDWHFADVTKLAGLGHNGFSAGIAVGDYDNDGFPDVYVSCYGPNVLFHNLGDGTFERADAGVADERWGTSAAFFDYDDDGLLDLYVCNYAKWTLETNQFCGDRSKKVRLYCSPQTVDPEGDVLYRNRGDGTFEDATEAAGVGQRLGRAQGVVAADFNDDGRVDLYVGNDLHANSLFLNRADGTFRDASELSGAGYDHMGNVQAGMGVDVADTNHDGRFELFVTNFQGEHNSLYLNDGGDVFQEASHRVGLATDSLPWVGWGTAFADFDLDGWPDLIVTNGHVDDNRHLLGQDAVYAQPPLLWRNVRGRFQLAERQGGDYFVQRHVGRGLLIVDLDNDGGQDVVITHQDARPALLRNARAAQPPARSVTLRLIGTRGNRDAVGSLLKLTAGERTVVQQVKGGGSYLSASDLRQVFAVQPTESPASIEIRWPNRHSSHLDGLEPGRSYLVIEPAEDSALTTLVIWESGK